MKQTIDDGGFSLYKAQLWNMVLKLYQFLKYF